MTQTTGGFIQQAGGNLYYEELGSGEPVIFAHAGFVDSRMWDAQWAAFAAQHRVIRFDGRGFGQSSPAAGPVERRAELLSVLAHCKIKRAAFVGCSLSGETLIDLALEQPELVSALVIISATPSGFELQGAPPAQLLDMFGALEQGDLAQAAELQTRIWLDGPSRQPDAVDPAVRQQVTAMSLAALTKHGFGQAEARPLEPPASQRLAELRTPSLIIAGALDHAEILRAAEVLSSELPAARKLIMPDCAHLPNMEQPAAFNQAVLEFLGAQERERTA